MNVRELIKCLESLPPDLEVAILDGFNGGGEPRDVNFGPLIFTPEEEWAGSPRLVYDDLTTAPGNPIVVMGYGCY